LRHSFRDARKTDVREYRGCIGVTYRTDTDIGKSQSLIHDYIPKPMPLAAEPNNFMLAEKSPKN